MAEKASKPTIRIELTPEQKKHVRQASGQDVMAPELLAEELEERIAPRLRIVAPED